jgi:hypothetical protein
MKEEHVDSQEQEVVLSDNSTALLALLIQWKRGLPVHKISPKLGLAEDDLLRELQVLERYQLVECDHGGPTDFHRPPSEQHRVQLWKLTPEGESLLSDGAITL